MTKVYLGFNMKYFLIFISFLASIVIFILFLLFTQSGNNIIKPYIQKEIQKRLNQEVNIEAFTLKTDFIDLEILINKKSKLILNGDFNLLSQNLNIEYIIDTKKLKTPYINIDGIMHMKGKVKGVVKDFQLDGKGVIFNSKLNFKTQITDKKIKSLQIKSKNVKIEGILAFMKKPIYSRGLIDIDIDVKPKNNNTYVGKSNILIHFGTLDIKLLKQDFDIELQSAVTYRGSINSTINGETLYVKSEIFSNIAKIETKKSEYNINKKIFYSDYQINIPKLSSISNKIQGSISLNGNIQKTLEDFSFDLNSKDLGGITKVIVFNDTLKIDARGIKLSILSYILKQPRYSDGTLKLSLDMQDTKPNSRDGKLTLHVEDGTLHVKELIENKKQDNIKYKLSLISDIKQDNASIDSNFSSDVLKLDISNSNLNIESNTIKGKYVLKVDDLNNLYFITNRPLKGDLTINGNYLYDTQLYLDGNSSFLNATTNFEFKNNLLHVKSDELDLIKVTDMLYYPRVFDSFATLEGDYNLTNEVGIINLNALNGRLIKSELTEIINIASGFDLTSEIYKDTLLRGVLNKNKIDFSLLMNGLESYFKIPDGYIDIKSNEINSDFDIKIQNKDFKGTIKGSLDKPKVELSGSEYIKQKINKAIDKNIPKEWQDTAKELLNLFG
jgi:hypothetical protein